FMQCLGEITTSNKIRKSLQELAYVNRGTMQVEQAFGENSNRDDTAAQNWPHQQAALLDVINHADFSNALSQLWQANNLRLSAALGGKREPLASSSSKTGNHRRAFSHGFAEGDGRLIAAPVRPSNFPDASKME